MLNFINNSIKYSENENIYITLKDLDNHTIQIDILYNGTGSLNK